MSQSKKQEENERLSILFKDEMGSKARPKVHLFPVKTLTYRFQLRDELWDTTQLTDLSLSSSNHSIAKLPIPANGINFCIGTRILSRGPYKEWCPFGMTLIGLL